MKCLALDVGGANLKIANGDGFAATRYFPLWQRPGELATALASLLRDAPPADTLALTMTGELADCFADKAAGVRHIVEAVQAATDHANLWVYLTDGRFVSSSEACEAPLLAAASNWHALASYAASLIDSPTGMLLDIGSTTTDLIPLANDRPATRGQIDPERLLHGELIYTGVVRSPLCALVAALPWRGQLCPVVHEHFATTLDAYLWRGDLAEDPENRNTADGGPATREAARQRLARMICADHTMFDAADAEAAAATVAKAQTAKIGVSWNQVVRAMPTPPMHVVLSGQGEFLAREVVQRARLPLTIHSLSQQLGPTVSQAATAHALAILMQERLA